MSAGAEGIKYWKGIDPARAAGVTSIEENLCVDVKSGVCIPDTSSGDESVRPSVTGWVKVAVYPARFWDSTSSSALESPLARWSH